MAGGIIAYLVVLAHAPEVTNLEAYLKVRETIAFLASGIVVPSMAVVLASGLLAMAIHRPFHDAPWVLIKAVSGILIFEATLASIDSPAKRALAATERALSEEIDAAELAALVRDEWVALWVILGLAAANVALGIWRPRFRKLTEPQHSSQRPTPQAVAAGQGEAEPKAEAPAQADKAFQSDPTAQSTELDMPAQPEAREPSAAGPPVVGG